LCIRENARKKVEGSSETKKEKIIISNSRLLFNLLYFFRGWVNVL